MGLGEAAGFSTGQLEARQEDPLMPLRSVQIPYQNDAWATLEADFPLTSACWDQMMSTLNVMHRALTVHMHQWHYDGHKEPKWTCTVCNRSSSEANALP